MGVGEDTNTRSQNQPDVFSKILEAIYNNSILVIFILHNFSVYFSKSLRRFNPHMVQMIFL